VPKHELMHCMWLWLNKVRSSTAAIMLQWDAMTAARWHRMFRQMVAQMIDNTAEGEGIKLGGHDENGEPIIVEVDESKFARRKCNGGRRVAGDWVVGMHERTRQRKCAMVVVNKRDAPVCIATIKKCTLPGSVVHSDMWGGCNPIKRVGYNCQHRRLNHSKEFVNYADGHGGKTHAQTTEGTWGTQKQSIQLHKRNGPDLQDCLFEFMWRRANAGNLWKALLEGLSKVRMTMPELLRVDQVDETWEPTDVLMNVEDCEDCDSEATEDTLSEVEDNMAEAVPSAEATAPIRRARRGISVRAPATRRQEPAAEAVPSAVFRLQEKQRLQGTKEEVDEDREIRFLEDKTVPSSKDHSVGII